MSVSKVSMWLNGVVEEAVLKCGERYGFSGEEAMRELFGEGVGVVGEKSKKGKEKSEKKAKASIPLPFNGEFSESLCFGLQTNNGLYTQCGVRRQSDKCYCKQHQTQADKNVTDVPDNGTIQQRMASDLLSFTTPSGKSVTPYSKIMKKLNITMEKAQEEAGKVNVTIDARHFIAADEEAKKGRPKKEKAPKEAKATKGRPKKEKMSVEISEPKDDLFATLVAQAASESSGSESESEPESETEMSAMSAADKESHAAEKEAKKNEKKAEKEAKKAQEKAEKKAKEEAAKAEKKALEDAAKAEKKALEEAAKAEKKAQEAAKKKAKSEKKPKEPAAKKAPKKVGAKKEEPKPEPEPAESEESEDEEEEEEEDTYDAAKVEAKMPDVVNWFEFEGKKYLKSKNTGVVYSSTQEVVGKWNATTKTIDFNEEEEEDESSDSDSDEEECEEDNYEA